MTRRTARELQALIVLLGDEDLRTATVAREKLRQVGESALAFLADAVRHPDARIRARSRLLIEDIQRDLLAERFRRYAALPDRHLDLETGAFLVASYGYPEVDMEPYRRELDRMAQEVRQAGRKLREGKAAFPPGVAAFQEAGLPPELAALHHCLFHVYGFRGNEQAYYDPDNSYLNRVLDRRLGIPISLSVLYLLLAQRLQLPAYGVGLPGHFLVAYQRGLTPRARRKYPPAAPDVDFSATVWIDPFHGGRILDEETCHALARTMGYQPSRHYLRPAPVRLIIIRMLMNLVNIYRRTQQPGRVEELHKLVQIVADGPEGSGPEF